MKLIRIFIASSNELEYERLHIDSLILQLNTKFFKDLEIEIEPVKWEFCENMDKQEEYNQELSTCDICVVLFWNKIGPYTKEEFDLAYQLSEQNHVPYLYVYFKEPTQKDTVTSDFRVFKEGYQEEYKRYPSKVFENIDTLKSNLILRLLDYLHIEHRGHIKFGSNNDTRVYLKNVEIADLRNVPCFFNNDDYYGTIKELDEIQRNLELFPETEYLLKKSAELQKKKRELENGIFDCAAQVTRNLAATSSKRLLEASNLLEQGKYKEALELLNENTIDSELEQCINLYNKTINNLSNPIRDTIVDLINQYETRCQALILSRKSVKQYKDDIKNLFFKIIKASSNVNDESFLSDKYDHYFSYLRHVKDYHEAVRQINTFLLCCNSIEIKTHWMSQLAMCYKECGDFSKAIETYKKVLPLLKGLYSAFGKQYALQYAQVCGDYATTMSSIIGNEKNATSVLLESYHVFKDNSLTDSYSFIHVTESLVEAFISIRDIEIASKYLDELKDAIESFSDNDVAAMASLKLRFVLLKMKLDTGLSKLSASRLLGYITEANANCIIIQKQSGYREVLLAYYLFMVNATMLLDDKRAAVFNPKIWLSKAKIEMAVIKKEWCDMNPIFNYEIDFAMTEINCIFNDTVNNNGNGESLLDEKFKHALISIFCYVEEKHILNAVVLRFLDMALYMASCIGTSGDYADGVSRIIDLYNKESSNLDEFIKKHTDFKIKVYRCLNNNCERIELKELYNEYSANYSLFHFLNSHYTIIHAAFLNNVVYYVLIGEARYEEALSLINDALSLDNDFNYMDTKAEVLYRMGRREEAESIVREIIANDSEFYPLGNEYLYNELCKSDELLN